MPTHSERRATLRPAKIGPPFGVAAGSSPDCVAALERATSPSCAPRLAGKLPAAITAVQYDVIVL